MPFHKNELCGMVTLCEGLSRISFYSPVPLVSVHVDVKVVNFTAQVVVTQEFVNRERNPIECVYFFPAEEEAAVVDFTAELEGRKVQTMVKEKEAAREEYNQAVRNKQTAFLLEETKPDIFEIKIGHLSPGAGCKIKMTYLSELPVEEGKTKLTIPTTVAPRYIPTSDGSPEATKIASIQHDFNSPVQMQMNLEVLMQTEITSIKSPSHSLTTPTKKRLNEYFEAKATFAGHTTNMDRDMVIYIDTEEPNQPKVVVEKNDEGSSVAMLSFVPGFKLKDHQVEAVFLVDCSGSMSGQSMNLAKEALQVFLHSLPVNSFFNIILFGSTFKSLFPQSRQYDDDSLRDAKDSAAGISANLGGTEIFQPLQHIFQMPLLAGLARQVFVLTDGQVSNSTACIDLVRKNSSTNRVFTLGIGSSADRHLVKGMARAGMGTASFTTEGEPITAKVINQLKNGLQPCISDVSVKWGKANDFEGSGEVVTEVVETKKTLFGYGKTIKQIKQEFSIQSQVPSKVPAIYDGSRLIAYKLLNVNMESNDEITVKAKTPEGDLEVSLPICKDSFIDGNSVHQLFARKMIQEVEEKHGNENIEDSKKLITELGLKYKLASKYTSFVGVDEKQGNNGDVMVTRHIKNQMPQNSAFGSSFGGTRSASYAVVDSAPRSRGYMAPPGASYMESKGGFRTGAAPPGAAPPGAAPPGASRSFGSMTMSDNAVDSACMSDSSDDSYDGLESATMGLESLTRSVPQYPKSSSSSPSDVVRLTMDQAANGSFLPKESIASIVGVELKTVLDAGTAISSNAMFSTIWMTLVVVTFLTEKCQDEKDVWELVVEKAQKWLQKQDTVLVKGHHEKAKEFITKAVSMRRTCPSGHMLSMVTSGAGSLWHCDSNSRCVAGCNSDGEHPSQSVWRCSQDKRVMRGGSCDFDICGDCVKQNV
eukprot:TRINITY_DN6757_c0_g1_i1.p1 TRINITY_DN6757_c0_g1~~TRINITY_DN6757_c0_g1_i1.p1  ORF type:complete len:929 (+),score=240.22 TRINITY_DN6757_c0_g1_i1:18-2804(+)